jgi:transcriptional regulator with XRE-family HTH domain
VTRGERLKIYWEGKGYRSMREFAEFLGVSPSQISEADKKGVPAKLLHALSQKTDLNLKWWETGDGEMIAQDNPVNDLLRGMTEKLKQLESLPESQKLRLQADMIDLLDSYLTTNGEESQE